MENIFDKEYYDANYFAVVEGKKYVRPDGAQGAWSYANPEGEWLGCEPIVKAWKEMFKPKTLLDIGCGRGTFVAYCRAEGIEAYGFDFSDWACTHLYHRCDASWVTCRDATKEWGYPEKFFDLVTVLDLLEHIYIDDVDKVINQIYHVAKKTIFLQIATIGGGSGSGTHRAGYVLRKEDTIPTDLEYAAVAGHVTVQDRAFWVERLRRDGWRFRDDLILEFIKLVPLEVITNWVKNTILIVEREEQSITPE